MTERITTANDKYARELGFDYGNSTSNVQAQFFNGLAEGLHRPRGSGDLDMQIAYITHDLTPQAKALLKMIGEFCNDED